MPENTNKSTVSSERVIGRGVGYENIVSHFKVTKFATVQVVVFFTALPDSSKKSVNRVYSENSATISIIDKCNRFARESEFMS